MVPIMGRRFTAVLISLVVFTCQWLMPAPAHAAMDVAKQVLIGADYSNKDLRGATSLPTERIPSRAAAPVKVSVAPEP